MNQKKAVKEIEKWLAHYHACSEEMKGKDYVAITVSEHYSRMADLAGKCIKIVEGRI